MPLTSDVTSLGADARSIGFEIQALTVGPFQSNCYLVRERPGTPALVIDPGDEPARIMARLAAWGSDADVAAILLTHAHLDHVGAVAELVRATSAPVHLHPDDLPMYEAVEEHARVFGLRVESPPPPDELLAHGKELEFGGLRFGVRHAPGHSPGSVLFTTDRVAFVGDVVFAGSIGRTDLPGGDSEMLLASIRREVLSLEPDVLLLPGHMGPTTVAHEAATNPFFGDGEPCLHCGHPVSPRLMGCKAGHCPNCHHPYPHGDCSD